LIRLFWSLFCRLSRTALLSVPLAGLADGGRTGNCGATMPDEMLSMAMPFTPPGRRAILALVPA
jgi:hypothetical protein